MLGACLLLRHAAPLDTDLDHQRPHTRRRAPLPHAGAAARAVRHLLGRQHGGGAARHRRDRSFHADRAALDSGGGGAVADLRRGDPRALGRDPAAAAVDRAARHPRHDRLQRALLRRRPLHERHQHRHPAGLDADLRAGRRLPRARHAREPDPVGGRADHGAGRGGGGDARRAAGDPRGRAQQGRPRHAGGVRPLRALHRGPARPPGDAGQRLLRPARDHRGGDVAAAGRLRVPT